MAQQKDMREPDVDSVAAHARLMKSQVQKGCIALACTCALFSAALLPASASFTANRKTQTTYTDSGQIERITLTPGSGSTTHARIQSYRYDAQDRLVEAISPEGSITATGAGASACSTATTIDYDALNRPIKQTDITGSGANQKLTQTTWQYDANGNKIDL